MNKAIEHLKATGMEVREEDVKRLTSLGYGHVRLTGRYDFTLRAEPEVGGLRTATTSEAVMFFCKTKTAA